MTQPERIRKIRVVREVRAGSLGQVQRLVDLIEALGINYRKIVQGERVVAIDGKQLFVGIARGSIILVLFVDGGELQRALECSCSVRRKH